MKNIHVIENANQNPHTGALLLRHIWKGAKNECKSLWQYKGIEMWGDTMVYTTLNGGFADWYKSFKVVDIYITNDEKFVRNEWITDGIEVIEATPKLVNSQGLVNRRDWRKIVLTTDRDLIEDGVNVIGDTFIEWFRNNQDCTFVDVEKFHGINTSIAEVNTVSGDGSLNWQGRNDLRDYKINIPGEIKLKDVFNDEKRQGVKELIDKHKTIEGAFEMFMNKNFSGQLTKGFVLGAMKFGVKWQQEQDKNTYTLDEVLEVFEQFQTHLPFHYEFLVKEHLQILKNKRK